MSLRRRIQQILTFIGLTIVVICSQNCSGFTSTIKKAKYTNDDQSSQGEEPPPPAVPPVVPPIVPPVVPPVVPPPIPQNPVDNAAKVNPFACSTPTIGVENIRRLSRPELENTLKNLLGPNIYANVADALGGLYQDTITKSVADFSQQINDSQMNGYEAVADRILTTLTSKPNLVSDFGIACTSATMTNACRDTIINALALKAYRRPLTTTELKALQDNVFTLGTTTAEKIGFVLYRLVMSPDFLMRLEKGSGSTTASEFNLTPYEVASRISYMIGDSPPDDQLFAAAAAGQLQTEQQIQPHIDRLFAKTTAKTKIHNFFNYWLQPKSLSANGYAADFLAGLNIGLASPEYLREMDEFIDYVIFVRQGSLNDLLTSRDAFPRNSQAASVLGSRMLASNEQTPAQTDMNRIGLLMRPSVLATDGNEVHPIVRGAKFRSRFLCESTGVPAGVALAGDLSFSSDTAKATYSTRYRTEKLTASTSCMACHSSINPVGFVFQHIDNFGRYRSIEKSYAANGTVLGSHPIDASVAIKLSPTETEKSVSNGVEFISQLAERNRLPACFATQMHRFYRLRIESAADSCVQQEVYNDLAVDPNKSLLDAFKKQILNKALLKRRIQ